MATALTKEWIKTYLGDFKTYLDDLDAKALIYQLAEMQDVKVVLNDWTAEINRNSGDGFLVVCKTRKELYAQVVHHLLDMDVPK